jgi:hypothetical protein
VPLTTQPHSPIRCGVSGPSNTTDPNMAGYRWSAPSSARALVAKVDDAGADRRDRDPPPAAQTSRIRRNRICGLTGRGLADPYYAVTQRDMPLSEAPIRIARRAEPVPHLYPCVCRGTWAVAPAPTFRLAIPADANTIKDRNTLSPRQLRHCYVSCGLPRSPTLSVDMFRASWIIDHIHE